MKKLSGYVSGHTAFNNRTENFCDEFRYGIETGIGLLDQGFWITDRLYGVESIENGATDAETINTSNIFANNSEYISAGIELSLYVTKKLGFSAAYAGLHRPK